MESQVKGDIILDLFKGSPQKKFIMSLYIHMNNLFFIWKSN
jgi:hypothetical protein